MTTAPGPFDDCAIWRRARKEWKCHGRPRLDGGPLPDGHTPVIAVGARHLEWIAEMPMFARNYSRYCEACANAAIAKAREATR